MNPKVTGWKSQHQVHADDYSDDLDAVDKDGCVPVPQGVGLGYNLNWDWINKHATGTTVYE